MKICRAAPEVKYTCQNLTADDLFTIVLANLHTQILMTFRVGFDDKMVVECKLNPFACQSEPVCFG